MDKAMEIDNDVNNMVVVPWFSMAEWKEVYKQIFSSDTPAQQKGYERLLVWKARCPSLPTGVECTLGLMQIHLYDQEVWPQIESGLLPLYREQDLRLLYSTSIMRFLNKIADVTSESRDTYYSMARKCQIPGWVVDIRHDVAHGLTMPSLAILRKALEFGLSWIHDQYWKDETEKTANYVALAQEENDPTPIINKLKYRIELWQALKLYCQVGFEEMNSIPDAKFKLEIFNIVGNSFQSLPELEQQRTKKVLGLVFEEIELLVDQNKEALSGDNSLVTILLGSETFLLGENMISSLKIDESEMEDALPIKLCGLWQEMIKLLQRKVNILPNLLVKLIELAGKKEEGAHRRKLAAIWVREICRGIMRAKATGKVVEKMIPFLAQHHISIKGHTAKFEIRKQFEHCYPDLKTAFALKLLNLPVVNRRLIMLAMENPSRWTATFLPSLMKVVEPAMTKSKQASLMNVLEIYTNENINPGLELADPFIPYTIEALEESFGVESAGELPRIKASGKEKHYQLTKEAMEETWCRSEEYHEWEKCPLGVLPWQRKLAVVDFCLPPETVWIPSQRSATFEKTDQVRKGLTIK